MSSGKFFLILFNVEEFRAVILDSNGNYYILKPPFDIEKGILKEIPENLVKEYKNSGKFEETYVEFHKLEDVLKYLIEKYSERVEKIFSTTF